MRRFRFALVLSAAALFAVDTRAEVPEQGSSAAQKPPVQQTASSVPSSPGAGVDLDTLLARGSDHYEAARYGDCVKTFTQLLERESQLELSKRSVARVYLAACLIALERPEQARRQLRQAILVDRKLEAPDPIVFPQRVIEEFIRVRSELVEEEYARQRSLQRDAQVRGSATQTPTPPNPQATTGAAPEQPATALPPGWRGLWSVKFAVSGAGALSTLGVGAQIAIRGPLVVAPSEGTQRGAPDADDGVFLVDGRRGQVVRHLLAGGGDTWGVTLDEDHVVFIAGSQLVRARLDGWVEWRTTIDSGIGGVATLYDLNQDGTRDVLVLTDVDGKTSAVARKAVITAWDGASGRRLWRVERDPARHAEVLASALHAGTELSDDWFAAYLRVGPPSDGQFPTIRAGEGDLRLSVSLRGELTHGSSSALEPERDLSGPARAPGSAALPGVQLPSTEIWLASLRFKDDTHSTISLSSSVESERRRCTLWFSSSANAPRALPLDGCGSFPSIGNLDGDEVWDLVIADATQLRAFSTGISADLSLGFARGDLQATGMLPEHLESLATYHDELPVRDTDRWLAPQRDARDDAFRALPEPAAGMPGADVPPLPDALAKFEARELARENGRSAALIDGVPTVCWGTTECSRAPAGAVDLAFARLSFEPGAARLWALSESGGIWLLEQTVPGWQEKRWPLADGALRGAERLLVLPNALAVPLQGRFWLLPRDAATPRDYASSTPLHFDQVVQCGERLFASNEGRLVAPVDGDPNRWAIVPGHPGPIRALSCSPDELSLTTAEGSVFELPLPGGAVRWAVWAILVACAAGLLVVAVWTVRARPPLVDKRAVVGRRWRIDAPLRRLQQAADAQQRLIRGLLDFIDNPATRPPLTIAVCGPWGSGKSSLMGILHDELRDTGRHVLVWFNAWRFQRETDITRAFYQSILDEFRRQASWPLRLKVLLSRARHAGPWRVLWFAVSTALALTALGLVALVARGALLSDRAPLTASLSLVVTVLLTVLGTWNRALSPLLKVVNVDTGKVLDQLKGRLRFARDLKHEFEMVFGGLGDALKLVVFVDDLDRCPPDRVTDMLEALNAIADTGHSVIVLGIDPAAVERAVDVRFRDLISVMRRQGSLEEARSFGTRYVEKMITVSVMVPELTASQVLEPAQLEPSSENVPKPWHRWAWPALGKAALHRAPLALTLTALLLLLGRVSAGMDLDLSSGALDRSARSLYNWCRELAAPRAAPAGEAAAAAKPAAKDAPEPPAQVAVVLPTPPAARPGEPTPSSVTGGLPEQKPARAAPAAAAVAPADLGGVDAPQLELVAFERRRELLDALAAFGFLLLGAAVLGLVARQARASAARPVTEDSQRFRAALAQASELLPPLPRTVIRFENMSRFLYHVVHQSPAWREGDEVAFFDLLVPVWLQRAPAGDSAPEWLQRELRSWLRVTARRSEKATTKGASNDTAAE